MCKIENVHSSKIMYNLLNICLTKAKIDQTVSSFGQKMSDVRPLFQALLYVISMHMCVFVVCVYVCSVCLCVFTYVVRACMCVFV